MKWSEVRRLFFIQALFVISTACFFFPSAFIAWPSKDDAKFDVKEKKVQGMKNAFFYPNSTRGRKEKKRWKKAIFFPLLFREENPQDFFSRTFFGGNVCLSEERFSSKWFASGDCRFVWTEDTFLRCLRLSPESIATFFPPFSFFRVPLFRLDVDRRTKERFNKSENVFYSLLERRQKSEEAEKKFRYSSSNVFRGAINVRLFFPRDVRKKAIER